MNICMFIWDQNIRHFISLILSIWLSIWNKYECNNFCPIPYSLGIFATINDKFTHIYKKKLPLDETQIFWREKKFWNIRRSSYPITGIKKISFGRNNHEILLIIAMLQYQEVTDKYLEYVIKFCAEYYNH